MRSPAGSARDRTNDLIYIADAVTARVLDCNATLPALPFVIIIIRILHKNRRAGSL